MKDTALQLFEGLAASYERALDAATLLQDRYWKRWVADRARVSSADRVLDVGCGTLLLEERLSGRWNHITGLDLTEEMIRIGQSKRLENVELLVNGDAEMLPLADESFDVVVSCYVVKYVDTAKFVSELARVTKQRGRVVVYDFVRPRGATFLILELYLHGALRVGGLFLRLAGKKTAFTFSNLGRIVDSATWDMRFGLLMERVGFEKKEFELLSGGVVAAYYGTKGTKTGRTLR